MVAAKKKSSTASASSRSVSKSSSSRNNSKTKKEKSKTTLEKLLTSKETPKKQKNKVVTKTKKVSQKKSNVNKTKSSVDKGLSSKMKNFEDKSKKMKNTFDNNDFHAKVGALDVEIGNPPAPKSSNKKSLKQLRNDKKNKQNTLTKKKISDNPFSDKLGGITKESDFNSVDDLDNSFDESVLDKESNLDNLNDSKDNLNIINSDDDLSKLESFGETLKDTFEDVKDNIELGVETTKKNILSKFFKKNADDKKIDIQNIEDDNNPTLSESKTQDIESNEFKDDINSVSIDSSTNFDDNSSDKELIDLDYKVDFSKNSLKSLSPQEQKEILEEEKELKKMEKLIKDDEKSLEHKNTSKATKKSKKSKVLKEKIEDKFDIDENIKYSEDELNPNFNNDLGSNSLGDDVSDNSALSGAQNENLNPIEDSGTLGMDSNTQNKSSRFSKITNAVGNLFGKASKNKPNGMKFKNSKDKFKMLHDEISQHLGDYGSDENSLSDESDFANKESDDIKIVGNSNSIITNNDVDINKENDGFEKNEILLNENVSNENVSGKNISDDDIKSDVKSDIESDTKLDDKPRNKSESINEDFVDSQLNILPSQRPGAVPDEFKVESPHKREINLTMDTDNSNNAINDDESDSISEKKSLKKNSKKNVKSKSSKSKKSKSVDKHKKYNKKDFRGKKQKHSEELGYGEHYLPPVDDTFKLEKKTSEFEKAVVSVKSKFNSLKKSKTYESTKHKIFGIINFGRKKLGMKEVLDNERVERNTPEIASGNEIPTNSNDSLDYNTASNTINKTDSKGNFSLDNVLNSHDGNGLSDNEQKDEIESVESEVKDNKATPIDSSTQGQDSFNDDLKSEVNVENSESDDINVPDDNKKLDSVTNNNISDGSTESKSNGSVANFDVDLDISKTTEFDEDNDSLVMNPESHFDSSVQRNNDANNLDVLDSVKDSHEFLVSEEYLLETIESKDQKEREIAFKKNIEHFSVSKLQLKISELKKNIKKLDNEYSKKLIRYQDEMAKLSKKEKILDEKESQLDDRENVLLTLQTDLIRERKEVDKREFDLFLSSKKSHMENPDVNVSIENDIKSLSSGMSDERLKLEQLLNQTRMLIINKDFEKAKYLYNDVVEKFNVYNLDPNEKKIINVSIKELYNDMVLIMELSELDKVNNNISSINDSNNSYTKNDVLSSSDFSKVNNIKNDELSGNTGNLNINTAN